MLVAAETLRDHLIAFRATQVARGEIEHRALTLEDIERVTKPAVFLAALSKQRADLLMRAHELIGDRQEAGWVAVQRERALRQATGDGTSDLPDHQPPTRADYRR